jgi:hypothetical protein
MNKIITIFIFGVCLFSFGCNNNQLTGLVPAKGTLTFNGKPIAGASVTFNPVGQTRSASGITDAQGNFSMMTLVPNDGVYPGEYIVTVDKTEYRGEMHEELDKETKKRIVHDTREVIEHLPLKYAEANTTDLKVTIPDNGNTKLIFELTGEADSTPKKLSEIKRH